MVKLFTVFALFLLLSTNTNSAEYFKNAEAANRVKGARELWYRSNTSTPSYIGFQREFPLDINNVFNWLRDEFNVQPEINYNEIRSFVTKDQITHTIYGMSRFDIPVEFLRLTIHSKDGRVVAISGNILSHTLIGNIASITKEKAIEAAIESVHAGSYKWQFPKEEDWLKKVTGDATATFYPSPELVIVARNGDYARREWRYAYKMNIYSEVPNASVDVYVDAGSADVIFSHNMINEADSTGLAHTAVSGIRQIKTDLSAQNFRLREFERGNGINTWNLQNNMDISLATDFFDENNEWIYTVGDKDAYATDAHWGAEMTFDYLKTTFNRMSIDDNGFILNNYIHYGESYNNARWDKILKVMMYGDGPANLIPLASVDIVGHEIGHGLTQFTADLMYENESGALNESFSDILGNCVESFGKGIVNWQIGEDIGSTLRDMKFPNGKEHPDTYKGNYWYSGPNDNGGVHTNSGVQNYWFYLLSEGGNGINDLEESYEVEGVGIINAALIAYRNLTVYMGPTSDYEEAAFFATKSAIDIFGNCSPQHESTVRAWNAVGLENNYIDEAVASFESDQVTYCALPVTIRFNNSSVNGETYHWDFGDGSTSVLENPEHTYNTEGSFTVKLSVDGNGCGTDAVEYQNLLSVSATEDPQASSASIFKGDSTVLNATSASGEVHWYADAGLQTLIAKGNSYATPALYENTTYYIKAIEEGSVREFGESLGNSGNGQYSNLNMALLFDALRNIEILSIEVKTLEPGKRSFTIADNLGNLVFSKEVELKAGVNEVVLNAAIPKGNGYQFSYSGAIKNLWFSENATYPYDFTGLISVYGNTLGMENLYPYFFSIKVQDEDCESDMKEINVTVEDIATVKRSPYKFYVNNPEDFKYYIDFFFRENTRVAFGLYGINGQLVHELNKDYQKGTSTENVNALLEMSAYPSGVYFISINGGGLEKTEKIINKSGSN